VEKQRILFTGWYSGIGLELIKTRLFLPTILIVILSMAVVTGITLRTDDVPLSSRASPRPETTAYIPHVQIGVERVPKVNTELFRRVYSIFGIENRPSIISLPGARGLWLSEELSLEHPEVIVAGREFAHIHPDGSLHISLPPARALEAVETGWAIQHPFASQRKGWEGFVMLYTPQSMEELNVIFQLIVDGYNFVTGQKIQAADYYD